MQTHIQFFFKYPTGSACRSGNSADGVALIACPPRARALSAHLSACWNGRVHVLLKRVFILTVLTFPSIGRQGSVFAQLEALLYLAQVQLLLGHSSSSNISGDSCVTCVSLFYLRHPRDMTSHTSPKGNLVYIITPWTIGSKSIDNR